MARKIRTRYFNIARPIIVIFAVFITGAVIGVVTTLLLTKPVKTSFLEATDRQYWLELHRKSQKEYLYLGVEGNKSQSSLVKIFDVKTGVENEKPTPLPQILGKSYWKIIKKYSSSENPETAPYFLELDIPVEDGFYGPVPYKECDGQQCSWELPGYFGLHGVNGDNSKLSKDNPGSSGCIRHKDNDIVYLYNLLNVDEGVRYYVKDI